MFDIAGKVGEWVWLEDNTLVYINRIGYDLYTASNGCFYNNRLLFIGYDTTYTVYNQDKERVPPPPVKRIVTDDEYFDILLDYWLENNGN